MKKKKRGMETVVAWVLLLGFSITLGTFVFMWATRSSEEMTESTTKFVEGGMQCEQVQMYAVFTEDPDNPGGPPCGYISITNRGYLTIEKIKIRGINKNTQKPLTNQETYVEPLSPKEKYEGLTATWGLPASNAEVELIPIVREGNNMIGCTDRMTRVEC